MVIYKLFVCIVKKIEIENIINFVIVIMLCVIKCDWFVFKILFEIVLVNKIKKNINN